MNHPKIFAVLGVACLAVVTLVRSRADDGKRQSEHSAAQAGFDPTGRSLPGVRENLRRQDLSGLGSGHLDVEDRRGLHARPWRKFATGVHDR